MAKAKSKVPRARAWMRGPITSMESARTTSGICVCRIGVSYEVGPVSNPVAMSFYIVGKYAEKCASVLRKGDLIEARGEILPQRLKVPHQEVEVLPGGIEPRERPIGATA